MISLEHVCLKILSSVDLIIMSNKIFFQMLFICSRAIFLTSVQNNTF